ncbi:MAG: NeuD/PglB/VioB family sugar acetyltransferase [Chloroflexi bacterium]|nr:NeuD/PglB/VioB family sugar acetyltransferase [Chloroflexota bacterium]
MGEYFQISIPLLNPNEPEAMLAALHVTEGQQVAEGDLICTLETTKSTAEVAAESAGYVAGLQFAKGDTVRAGDVLCYLTASPDEWVARSREQEAVSRKQESGGESSPLIPENLRITQPALTLARKRGLDLDQFPIGPLVTEKMVRARLASPAATLAVPESEFDPTAIIIYGGGGHGKSLLDLLRSLGTYRVVGFVDDGLPAGDAIMGLPVLGGSESLPYLYAQGTRLAVNAVGGIGRGDIRIQVFRQLAEAGFACPAVVHPTAFIEPGATLAPGVQVFPHAYVGSEARVGFGSIVNTGAILSHDCVLGNFVNISPGAILAGEVQVGNGALIGMGVTVNLQAKVGAGTRIGNGATIKSDVPDGGVVRAGGVWPA